MPTAPYFTALLAAGPDFWGYPKWQERTNFIVPPFDADATTALTGLSAKELSALKTFAERIHSIQSPAEVLAALAKARDNDLLGRRAWETWAKEHFKDWNLVPAIEGVLEDEDRHPSQLIGQQNFVSAECRYVRTLN